MGDHRVGKNLFLAVTVFGLAACASSSGGQPFDEEGSDNAVSIQITNDINPPAGIVVWAVPENSSRRRLGFVSPNGRRSFSYSPMDLSLQVYLLAVPEGPSTGTMGQAGERRSSLFSLLDVKTVQWSVSRTNVRIGG